MYSYHMLNFECLHLAEEGSFHVGPGRRGFEACGAFGEQWPERWSRVMFGGALVKALWGAHLCVQTMWECKVLINFQLMISVGPSTPA